jgi:PAS domain S-box-containing protein
MQIKQRLRINSMLTAMTALVVLLVLFVGLHEVKKAVRASKTANELATSAFERATFSNDYLRNGSERAKKQWFAKHAQIGLLLKSASAEFTGPEDRKITDALNKDHEITFRSFSSIVENREKTKPDTSFATLAQERENRLTAQLEMRLYNKILLLGELQKSAGHRLYSVLLLEGSSIIFVLTVLIAWAVYNSWSMNRTIVDRMRKLGKGVSVIGNGDLGYRIPIKSDDEFAQLSNAFNAMSGKLMVSYRELEKEIHLRRQAEEALRKANEELEDRVHQRTKELKKAVETIEAERQRLFDVLETLPPMICLLTPDYHVAFANRSFRERFGRSEGRHCYEYCLDNPEPCANCESFSVLKTGRPHHWEVAIPSGRIIDVYDFPFTDTDGSRLILEMGIDITEQRQAEKALRELNETLEQRILDRTAELRTLNESLRDSRTAALHLMEDAMAARKEAEETSNELRKSEERFRSTLDTMLEGCQMIGFDWRYIYLNGAADIHNRRPKEELMGNRYMDMWPGIEETELFRVIRHCLEERVSHHMENLFTYPDGTSGWFDLSIQPIPEGVFILSIDITERKNIEDRNKVLADIVGSSDNAIIGKSLEGIITSWNRGAERMYGYTKDEIIGRPITDLVPPELKDEMAAILERMRGGEMIEHIETMRVKKDGTRFPVSISVSPIYDAEGKVTGASTIAQDITARKKIEAEMFSLLAELERSNKDLEQFAYVASHDLQEPLRMVSSFTQLLARHYKDRLDQDANDYIEYAVDGANRMQRLINDLLSYSRITTRGSAPVPVDMNAALGEALGNLYVSISESSALVTNDTLPMVTADYTQLVQVFQNLISNAVKFHGDKPPRIHVSAEKADGEWKISVRDNGIGIEARYFDRIFVIFQRLHSADKYQGTGIGLALCKRIIQRFGGNMWVESEPGRGSTFSFTLKGVT